MGTKPSRDVGEGSACFLSCVAPTFSPLFSRTSRLCLPRLYMDLLVRRYVARFVQAFIVCYGHRILYHTLPRSFTAHLISARAILHLYFLIYPRLHHLGHGMSLFLPPFSLALVLPPAILHPPGSFLSLPKSGNRFVRSD